MLRADRCALGGGAVAELGLQALLISGYYVTDTDVGERDVVPGPIMEVFIHVWGLGFGHFSASRRCTCAACRVGRGAWGVCVCRMLIAVCNAPIVAHHTGVGHGARGLRSRGPLRADADQDTSEPDFVTPPLATLLGDLGIEPPPHPAPRPAPPASKPRSLLVLPRAGEGGLENEAARTMPSQHNAVAAPCR